MLPMHLQFRTRPKYFGNKQNGMVLFSVFIPPTKTFEQVLSKNVTKSLAVVTMESIKS
jgi:hypothetical protein